MMEEVVLLPDPLVWDEGGRKKARRTDIRVNIYLASLPGAPGFLGGPWMQVDGYCCLALQCWHSLQVYCFPRRFTSFLGTLHWPSGSDDMGHLEGFFFGAPDPFRAIGWSPFAQ